MSPDDPDGDITTMEGATAPPRKNGELVFDAPWESRVFGMAVALHECGVYEWRAFSERLGAEITEMDGAREAAAPVLTSASDVESTYYTAWLQALEALIIERGILSRGELDALAVEIAAGALDGHH